MDFTIEDINEELYEEEFCEIIDKKYPEMFGKKASSILKRVDQIMYRELLLNYIDSLLKGYYG